MRDRPGDGGSIDDVLLVVDETDEPTMLPARLERDAGPWADVVVLLAHLMAGLAFYALVGWVVYLLLR